MIRLLLTVAMACASFHAHCQVKPQQVRVTDWRRASAALPPTWWPIVKEKVRGQLSREDFDRLATYDPWVSKPQEMSWTHARLMANRDSAEFVNKMNELKLYQIAAYATTPTATMKEPVEKVILKIPYDENRNWMDTVKWDHLYIVISKEFVRPVEE